MSLMNIFAALSVLAQSSAMNGVYDGKPRAPNKYEKKGEGEKAAHVLVVGDTLSGPSLQAASVELRKNVAILYWLGDTDLAMKYGAEEPERLTPVEEERWNRTVASLGFFVGRVGELLASVQTDDSPEVGKEAALTSEPEVGAHKPVGFRHEPTEETQSAPEKTVDSPPVAPRGKRNPNADILDKLVSTLDPEQRERLKVALGG